VGLADLKGEKFGGGDLWVEVHVRLKRYPVGNPPSRKGGSYGETWAHLGNGTMA